MFLGVLKKLDDWINPIAVKEIRQAVKGKFITATLLLFLTFQLIIIGLVLLLSENIGEDFEIGRSLFTALLTVLLVTCIFLLPSYAFLRFASEHSDRHVDLFFITTLRPHQIIWGKMMALLALVFLFFSASIPFLTFTFLLRGLDLQSVFILLGFDFLMIVGCIQFAILLACFRANFMSRAFFFFVGFGSFSIVFTIVMQTSFGMLFFGIGSSLGTWDFWGPALTVTVVMLMGIGFIFVLSVTAITPSSANRALPVRIYMFLIWMISGILATGWTYTTHTGAIMKTWVVIMVCAFAGLMLVALSERFELGPRIRRAIPRNILWRIPAFLLYSGAGSGIVFAIIMITASIIVVLYIPRLLGLNFSSDPWLLYYPFRSSFFAAPILALYVFCYSLTALTVKRVFFSKVVKTGLTTFIAVMLMLVGSAFPLIIGYLINPDPWYNLSTKWYIGSPGIVFFDESIYLEALTFTGIWGLGCFLVTLPWFINQVRSFKPLVSAQNNTVEVHNG